MKLTSQEINMEWKQNGATYIKFIDNEEKRSLLVSMLEAPEFFVSTEGGFTAKYNEYIVSVPTIKQDKTYVVSVSTIPNVEPLISIEKMLLLMDTFLTKQMFR
jgi:hypothetical protein